jgi:DNA-directed RNA polymerase subunit RPC12/RpoP
MIITLKCPECGASMEADDSRESCFCSYCGYKIVNVKEKVEISGAVKIDNSEAIENLLTRAQQLENSGKIDEAYSNYSRVLEMQPDNSTAQAGLSRVSNIITEPNVTIKFISENNPAAMLRIQSKKLKTVVANGGSVQITLPVGNNKVVFKGTKGYSRDIAIADRNTRVNVLYTEGKHVNRIDVY